MNHPIRKRALELGFDFCGFATAAAPETAGFFQEWLIEGGYGEMTYLPRSASKRIDPQKVLPGCKSVIAMAASYAKTGLVPPDPVQLLAASDVNPRTAAGGFIARYARFADYHVVLGQALELLCDWVNQWGGNGTRSIWYVDTGPVLEREFAQRAGLGFIGKHTNVISRRLGNWIFLAEILTTLELEPDQPGKNRCGSCTRCLDACPTRAIVAPFRLDARRCLSYLTIELKGTIPAELRPAIGNRIFGCDDCLAVCPWNRFAQTGRLMQNHARRDLDAPVLTELLALDETGFRARFGGTPLQRLKRRRLLRNVAVALGNIGGPSALPALSNTANDPDPLIAEHARWAINRIICNMEMLP
ncbi:MAG: tRNA epoxyqueuosine(34) reductase QueG [Candidatus Omnitrophica bacterium]|nr:tRNA epoxyqueuosine(34) reductase QueG [Candidatus Omnitrophota bacterium]